MKNPTVITVKQWDKTVTLEVPDSDLTVYDMLELFNSVLLALGYAEESITDTITRISYDINNS